MISDLVVLNCWIQLMTISAKERNATEDLRCDYFWRIKCSCVSYIQSLGQRVMLLQVKCMKN